MPPTPPPARTSADARRKGSPISSWLIRMGLSFLLGVVAFLSLLIVTGNKTFSEVLELLKGLLA